ncbi:MAG TPA: trehalose-phosphatase [Stellaceae bacterium]|nr:trehalose-phosphatase [Stellaceae bacterium]
MQRMPETLNPGTIGLFLDVDGTLLDIAPRPEAVKVTAELLSDLAAAEAALDGALALVSGRPIAELDRLFAPLRLAASGVHGAELRRRPDGAVTRLAAGQLGDDAWDKLYRLLANFPGSYAENKGVSFAVHYPDPGTDIAQLEGALGSLMGRLASAGEPLHLLAGHAVFELQLRGFDKGRAIRRFMKLPPFAGRRPVFIGDDKIDQAGFETAVKLGGLAYAVGIDMPGVSGKFANPDAVRGWLHELGR